MFFIFLTFDVKNYFLQKRITKKRELTATAEPQDQFTANVLGTARLQQQFLFFKNISISEQYYLLNSSMVVLFKYILLKTCCVLTFECQTRQKQDTIGDVLFLYLFDFEKVENKNIYERDWLYVIRLLSTKSKQSKTKLQNDTGIKA